MKSMRGQRGVGLFGLIFILGLIGFAAMLVIKCGPLYLNEMSIRRDVAEVANQLGSSGSEVDLDEARRALQKRWDIDYIEQLEAKDITITRGDRGLSLSYDYEARAHLFLNVFVVIHFAHDFPVRSAPNAG
jgi:hypothetical protein